jgi:hypothetical protein
MAAQSYNNVNEPFWTTAHNTICVENNLILKSPKALSFAATSSTNIVSPKYSLYYQHVERKTRACPDGFADGTPKAYLCEHFNNISINDEKEKNSVTMNLVLDLEKFSGRAEYELKPKFSGNCFKTVWEFPRQQSQNVRPNEIMNYRARQHLIGSNLTKRERDKLVTDDMRLLIARIYYEHFTIFKCGGARCAQIKQQRDRVWQEIIAKVQAEGFQFTADRIRQNFVNFVSETKNKKRRVEQTGAAREDFTPAEDYVILYEFAPTEEATRGIEAEDIGVAKNSRPSRSRKGIPANRFTFSPAIPKKRAAKRPHETEAPENSVVDDDDEEDEAVSEDEQSFRRSFAGGQRSPDGSMNPRSDEENYDDIDDVQSPHAAQIISSSAPSPMTTPTSSRRRILADYTATPNFFNDVLNPGTPSSSRNQPFTPSRTSSRTVSAATTPTSFNRASASNSVGIASASSSSASRASASSYRNNIDGPITSGPAQKSKSAKKSAPSIDYIQNVTAKYAQNAEKRAKLINMEMQKREIELQREKIQLEKDEFEREAARLKLEEMRNRTQHPE